MPFSLMIGAPTVTNKPTKATITPTKEQMRICDTIVRHETLGLVLEKADISDYYALQEKFRPGLLDFSDYDFTDDTRVILSDELLDDYERQKSEEFYRRWPLIISIIAIIISFLGSIGSDSLLGCLIGKIFE